MKSLENTTYIVRYQEAYLYKSRIWIFMEYLDYGCLTPILEVRKGRIPE